MKIPESNRRIRFLHDHVADEICKRLNQIGIRSHREFKIGNKLADVAIPSQDGIEVKEVGLSEGYQAENVKSALENGATSVQVLCRTRQILRAVKASVERTLPSQDSARITYQLIWPYLQTLTANYQDQKHMKAENETIRQIRTKGGKS